MTVKELIRDLEQYSDEDCQVWFHHKLRGQIKPEEVTVPIKMTELTASGIVLS